MKIKISAIVLVAFALLPGVFAVEILQPVVQVQPTTSLPPQHLGYNCRLQSNRYPLPFGGFFASTTYANFPTPFQLRTFSPGSITFATDPADPNYNFIVSYFGTAGPTIFNTCEDFPANPAIPEIITAECSNYYSNFFPGVAPNYALLARWTANEVSNGNGQALECQQWYAQLTSSGQISGYARQPAFFAPKTQATRITPTTPGPAVYKGPSGSCGGGPGGGSCNVQIDATPRPGTSIQSMFLQGPAPLTTVNLNQVFGPCPANQVCSFTFTIPQVPGQPAIWFISAVDSSNVISTFSITV